MRDTETSQYPLNGNGVLVYKNNALCSVLCTYTLYGRPYIYILLLFSLFDRDTLFMNENTRVIKTRPWGSTLSKITYTTLRRRRRVVYD